MAQLKRNQLNQILFPMVDKTDFATIESGLTASDITRRLFGVNHAGSAAATSTAISKVPSHVRSGIFRLTLKATECDYDFILVKLTHASCADQLIPFQMVTSDDSDILSALTVIQSMASDAASAATQANSRVLLNQSRISDIASYLVVMSGVQSDIYSLLSDVNSDLRSLLTTTGVTLDASTLSDIRSAIAAGPAATVTASDISDIASAVRAILVSDLSDILSAAVQANSRVLLVQSRISDAQSFLSDFQSDLLSLLTTTGVGLNASTMSDLRSAVAGVTATLGASDISDIASAVRAILISDLSDIHSAATAGASRALINQSRISDVQSYLVVMSGVQSDIYSLLSDANSDLGSRLTVVQSMASDAASAAQQAASRVLVAQSSISDVQSAVAALPTTLLDLSNGVETSITMRQALRLILAANAGKLSGAATTTVTIRDVNDTANRITATVDANGNRTAVTLSA